MRSWSIPIGRYFGVEFRVHLLFLLVLGLVWLTEASLQSAAALGRGLALTLLLLFAVLAKELVKAAVGVAGGLPLRAVMLLPIGGLAHLEETPAQSAEVEEKPAPPSAAGIRMALAGPLVAALLALLSAGAALLAAPEASLLAQPHLHSTDLLRSFVWINLYLTALSLLPAYPLDGGRILRAMFARHTDMRKATRRALGITQALALVMIFGGIFAGAGLMMAGFFLFVAGQMEERVMVFQAVLETVRMEDVMLTDFATLSPADTLEGALHKAVHSLQDDFPVIRGGDMVGVISKQKIVDALRDQGNGYVQAVMNKAYEVAQRKESLSSAFRKITRRGLTIIPVVDSGRLVGIVTLQNLLHSISLLAESKKLKRAAE
jgi:Zn-dependent protease